MGFRKLKPISNSRCTKVRVRHEVRPTTLLEQYKPRNKNPITSYRVRMQSES